jgi:hypothetical protein
LLILAYAITRPNRIKPAWSQQLKGWQKIFGIVAVLLAVLMMMNPELLALGLLGDTAFFDLLVLSLSLQLQTVVARAWSCVRAVYSRTMPVVIWRLWRDCSLMALAFAPVGEVISVIWKGVHRLSARAPHATV